MGCCGCTNKSSAVTAGILGLIQSIIGLIFNAYFINLFTGYVRNLDVSTLDERLFLAYAIEDVQGILMIILAVATILHSWWLLSSIILLIGNANDNACCLRQWVVCTSFIIIGDILFPIIVAAITFNSFVNVVQSVGQKTQSSVQQDNGFDNRIESVTSSITIDFYKYYIILLISFIKLGLITIIVNICLNVFTNRRAYEISNPRGYVMGTTVTIIQGQTGVPNVIQVGPGTVVAQPQAVYSSSGTANPYYAGNFPMQPAVAFSPTTIPNSDYLEANGSEAVCNSLSDPLLPPKYSKEC